MSADMSARTANGHVRPVLPLDIDIDKDKEEDIEREGDIYTDSETDGGQTQTREIYISRSRSLNLISELFNYQLPRRERDELVALEAQYGEEKLGQAIEWTADRHVPPTRAVRAIRTVLPQWNTRSTLPQRNTRSTRPPGKRRYPSQEVLERLRRERGVDIPADFPPTDVEATHGNGQRSPAG